MRYVPEEDAFTMEADDSQPNLPKPTSGSELLLLIQTLPMESGLPLLREHWSLLLPKDPGTSDLADWWGSLQKKRR